MPAEQFRIDYALSLVNAFARGGRGIGFARINRADVADGLRERIVAPKKVNQSAASLCGPAAFFYSLLEVHPELYAQYVIDLYDTGEARLKSLHVKPSSGCRAYAPPHDKIHPTDWIALASLRDLENTLLDYSSADDTAAGITMPHTLADWFQKVGFAGVRNNTNSYFLKGRREIEECARDFDADRRVCLFINMQMLESFKQSDHSWIPNHWVVLAKRPRIANEVIQFSVYSWGDFHDIPQNGKYPLDGFHKNFYGYVSATPTYS